MVGLGDLASSRQFGMANSAVERKCLQASASALNAWIGSILESGPRAIRLQKELIREWEVMPISDAIEAGIRCMVRAYQTDEPARMVGQAIKRLRACKGAR